MFEDGATPELRNIILFLENVRSLKLLGSLPRLMELELNGSNKPVLLPLLKESAKRIAEVILRSTMLNQVDLQVLAKKPNLQCLELLDSSYNESKLTFKKEEFLKLTLLTVDCPAINKITFTDGAVPKMEKITWTLSRIESLSGIKNLPKLNRLQLFGDMSPIRMRLVYTHGFTQEQQKQAKRGAEEDQEKDDVRFQLSCFTSKNWCISPSSP
uniref:FBD domain-containing protein n=1 Tax=Oryza barthii TaxID=65489 RepID=A0A0D3HPE8_9ORYZ